MNEITNFELMKRATFICCPWCDEPKCVGRFNCEEIRQWIEKKRKEVVGKE